MIAELFYPRELKQIIADLRAKDDLNEEALKAFAIRPVFFIFGGVCLLMIYLMFPPEDILIIIIYGLIITALVVSLFFIQMHANIRRMKVYLYGEIKTNAVSHIFKAGGSSPCVGIKLYDQENRKMDIVGPFVAWIDKKLCPQINEKVTYYSIGTNRWNNMPDRMDIKKHFCLSKSMLGDGAQ